MNENYESMFIFKRKRTERSSQKVIETETEMQRNAFRQKYDLKWTRTKKWRRKAETTTSPRQSGQLNRKGLDWFQ